MINTEYNTADFSTVTVKKELNNLRGKYIKRLLSQLEPLDIVDVVVRKLILDALNDYARDVNTVLGYE